jgi:TfoX/Sxy family transcriptional regulator of competence genes
MSRPAGTPEERYAMTVEALIGLPDVTYLAGAAPAGKSFGSTELKVRGKIFAMLVRGRLVVKLRQDRVAALVASGDGERFDPRRDGRLMKEWVVLEPTSHEEWLPLALEAMEFVAAKR